MYQHRIVLLLFLLTWIVTSANRANSLPETPVATVTWIGGTSKHWEEPSNWSTGQIPTAADDVIISGIPTTGFVLPVIQNNLQVVVNSITISNTNFLTMGQGLKIVTGNSLEVTGSIILNQGSLVNQGNLIAGCMAVETGAGLINDSSGTATIIGNCAQISFPTSSTIDASLAILGNGQFINSGHFVVGNTVNPISLSVAGSSFNNDGTLDVAHETDGAFPFLAAVRIFQGGFNNAGTLDVRGNASFGAQVQGIVQWQNIFSTLPAGPFVNTGAIHINDFTSIGLNLLDGTLNNEGLIEIGTNGNIGGGGIATGNILSSGAGSLTNQANGTIRIDNVGGQGISNGSSFSNLGLIEVLGVGSGDFALSNVIGNQFFNGNCGTVRLLGPIINGGFIPNQGLLIVETNEPSQIIGNLNNVGIIQDAQGSLSGIVNLDLLIPAITTDACGEATDALQLGPQHGAGGATPSIPGSTWYLEATLQTPAATYDLSTNDLTLLPGVITSPGDHQLYFTVDENVDGSGSSACPRMVTARITVNGDFDLPVLSCPADMTVDNTTSECQAATNFMPASATDACGTPVLSSDHPAGLTGTGTFPVGVTTINYTATDQAGNTATCSFDITVVDAEAPTFTCPSDLTVSTSETGCTATANYDLPMATDNCDGSFLATVFSGPAPGDAMVLGVNTVTLRAVDSQGNERLCSFDITVIDVQTPQITCPSNLSVECGQPAHYDLSMATDNCDSDVQVVVTDGPASGSVLDPGTYTVELTATDDAGNERMCTFDIIVSDTQAPSIACPADIILTCGQTLTYDLPTATDACSSEVAVGVQSGPLSGTTPAVGTYTVVLVATDDLGNAATCDFQVMVEDAGPPVLDCPADLTIACGGGVQYDLPAAFDGCTNQPLTVTVVSGPEPNTVFPPGVYTVELETTDENSNQSTCTFQLTLEADTEGPIFDCLPGITLECGQPIPEFDLPTAMDDCDGPVQVLYQGPAAGSTPSDDVTVTLLAFDAANNQTTCTFTITVEDTTPPVPDCSITQLTFECGELIGYPVTLATDICDGGIAPVVTDGPMPGTPATVGMTTATLTYTDDSGNSAECLIEVTVEDTQPPTIFCPTDLVINCGIPLNYTLPPALDACGGTLMTTVVSGPLPNSTPDVGTYTVTLLAVDNSGNGSTCSFSVTVEDPGAPVLVCPDDFEVECGDAIQYALPSVVDGCDPNQTNTATVVSGPSPGETRPVGVHTVQLELTDGNGNQSQCTFEVTVVDTQAPVFDCPADLNVSCGQTIEYALPTASDDCEGPVAVVVTGGPASGSTATGDTQVTLSATDAAGNTSTCSFNVTVSDTDAPVLTCPANLTVECGTPLSYPTATAMDACDGPLPTQQIGGPPSGVTISIPGTYPVQFLAVDGAGNPGFCTFQVTVVDTEAPMFTCPADLVLSCGQPLSYDLPTATDACEGTVPVSVQSGPASGTTPEVGVHTVTLIAMDASGNTATCSFQVTVQDGGAPTLTCPQDLNLTTLPGKCTAIAGYTLPTVDDVCGESFTVSVASGPMPGAEVGTGTHPVTVQAVNTTTSQVAATCSFTIQVLDNESPVVSTQAATITIGANGSATLNATDVDAGSTDNCGIATLTVSPNSFDCSQTGNQAVTLTATDAAGNTTSGTATVTVLDGGNCGGTGGYCAAAGLSTQFEWIERISLNHQENQSGDNGGYADFTAQTLPLFVGPNQIELQPGTSGGWYREYWRVYVDLNQDGDFTPDEKVFQRNSFWTINRTFHLPAGTPLGTTRMRIVMSYNGYQGPCGNFPAGEVEDYTVDITPFVPTYCNAGGADTQYEWIDRVQLTDLDHTSGDDGGYGDHTDQVANVTRGYVSILTAHPGFAGNPEHLRWAGWADWNQDGDFNDWGELLFYRYRKNSFNVWIYVPSHAALGETRLRLAASYGSWPTACANFQYGEVEDYTIHVSANGNNLVLADPDADANPKLTEFEAQRDGGTAQLTWNTNQGFRTDHYVVERSADGEHFDSIGVVTQVQRTNDIIHYELLDPEPLTGDNFYRLRSVIDRDLEEWSEVRRLHFEPNEGFRLYPNPAQNVTQLQLKYEGAADIMVTDRAGRVRQQRHVERHGGEPIELDVSELEAGTYHIMVKVEKYRAVSKTLVVERP